MPPAISIFSASGSSVAMAASCLRFCGAMMTRNAAVSPLPTTVPTPTRRAPSIAPRTWRQDSAASLSSTRAEPIEPVAFCPGYLRGMALVNNYALVGISRPRRDGTFTGLPLDNLLEDKVQSLARAEADAEQLNDSVLSLLEAVAQMSERDLTVSVPVTPRQPR